MTAGKTVVHPPYQDMVQFLQVLSHERYQAFILHAPAFQGKTLFARKLCAVTPGGVYLDLLQTIVNQPDLAHHLDVMDVPATRDFVLSYAHHTQARLLIVDELDFLLHTWSADLVPFKRMIEWLHCTDSLTCLGFVLQTRPVLEEWHPRDAQ
jgi:hypothetical protein